MKCKTRLPRAGLAGLAAIGLTLGIGGFVQFAVAQDRPLARPDRVRHGNWEQRAFKRRNWQ